MQEVRCFVLCQPTVSRKPFPVWYLQREETRILWLRTGWWAQLHPLPSPLARQHRPPDAGERWGPATVGPPVGSSPAPWPCSPAAAPAETVPSYGKAASPLEMPLFSPALQGSNVVLKEKEPTVIPVTTPHLPQLLLTQGAVCAKPNGVYYHQTVGNSTSVKPSSPSNTFLFQILNPESVIAMVFPPHHMSLIIVCIIKWWVVTGSTLLTFVFNFLVLQGFSGSVVPF